MALKRARLSSRHPDESKKSKTDFLTGEKLPSLKDKKEKKLVDSGAGFFIEEGGEEDEKIGHSGKIR